MPIFKFWKGFNKKQSTNNIDIVPHRFCKVFLDHLIELSQIPRLLPPIKLEDLQSTEKLLAVLTPEILDQTANLFNIRAEWLEGADDEIYEVYYCYKQPKTLLKHLITLKPDDLRIPLRVLTTASKLDCNDFGEQLLALILVEPVAQLGEVPIYRYYVYRDAFDWSYEPSRMQLKAMTRLFCIALRTVVPLSVISKKEMDAVLAGKIIPSKFVHGCLLTNPSLEDYSYSASESAAAKETEEMPSVLKYIERYELKDFSFVMSHPGSSSEDAPPVNHNQSKSIGKREKAQNEIWQPVINVASALWSEDNQLVIAEVIYRIKKMPYLKAASLSDSAIRKHIAPFAPDDIRGKSGRKPKKST